MRIWELPQLISENIFIFYPIHKIACLVPAVGVSTQTGPVIFVTLSGYIQLLG